MIRKLVIAGGLAALLASVAAGVTAIPASASSAPVAAGVMRDTNWAGHVVGYHAHGKFTEEQSEWEVPSVTCNVYEEATAAHASFWAGLGGVGSDPALVQAGVDTFCSLSGQYDQAWWEVYISGFSYPPVYLSSSQYPVHPGDYVYAQINYTGGGAGDTYTLYLANISERWDYTLDCPSSACVAYGSTVSIPSGYPGHAETVVERAVFDTPLTPLPNFHSVTFTDVRYYYAGTAPKGGFPVYVVEPPNNPKAPPEISVQKSLLNWKAFWEYGTQ